MRLRLSPGTVARGLRNQPYTPGRDLRFPYPIELDATDYPLGTTLVAATLVIAADFGLNPLISKQITPIASAAGQITDSGASGVGALYFAVSASELSPYRALGPIVFEVIVTDSRGLQGSLDIGSLYPTVSTAGAPVDHVLVTPNPFTLGFPATQQLVATAYDVDNNVLTGRTVTWASSDETIATVDGNGVVSVIAAGAAIITATIEGKSATSTGTFITPAALPLNLDWSPVAFPAEREMPFTFKPFAPVGLGDGNQQYIPQQVGSGLWFANRVAYIRNADEWAYCGKNSGVVMPADAVPQLKNISAVAITGSLDNTTAWKFTVVGFVGYENQVFAACRAQLFNPTVGIDDQDKTDYKRSMAVRVYADPAHPEEIGLPVVVQLVANIDLLGGKTVYKTTTVNLTASPQAVALDFDSYAQYNDPNTSWIAVGYAPGGANHFIVEFYSNDEFQAVGASPEWLRPAPWHNTLGVLSQFESRQMWWPSDDPALGGGAVKVGATTTPAPDAARYWSAPKFNRYTLPTGGYFTATQEQYESISDVFPSNIPTTAIYLGVYLKPAPGNALPADGVLKGYVTASTGTVYGPIDMVRDSAAVMRSADGSAYYRCRIPVNLALEGHLLFTPKIQNSGAAFDVLAYRCYAVSENERQIGTGPHMVVGKRAITGPVYNDAAFINLPDMAHQMSTRQGVLGIRSVKPYRLGALLDLPSPIGTGEFQSGPAGSADYTLDGADAGPSTAQGVLGPALQYTMQRGGQGVPFGDYIGWDIKVQWPGPVDATVFPDFVAADKWIAWWHDAGGHMHVLFGVGHGAGTGITWLADGATFLGATVTISTRDTTQGKIAWEFTDATGGVPFHMGLGADRDVIRMHGGFIQAFALGSTVPAATIAADLQASIEYHIFRRWKARKDCLLPVAA